MSEASTTTPTPSTATTSQRVAEVAVPPTAKMTKDQVRTVVGAKNVMGTCSG